MTDLSHRAGADFWVVVGFSERIGDFALVEFLPLRAHSVHTIRQEVFP